MRRDETGGHIKKGAKGRLESESQEKKNKEKQQSQNTLYTKAEYTTSIP